MSDEAGLPIDLDQDPPELKHNNLSVKYLDDEWYIMSTESFNLTNVASRRGSRMNL